MDETSNARMLAAFTGHAEITRALTARFGANAEDHVAEAVLRSAGANVRDESHARRWTARTAVGLGVDEWRHDQVVETYAPLLVEPSTAESPEECYLDTELKERAVEALAALSSDRRQAIQAHIDGVALPDIASQLGRSVYAVKHLIARAREQMRVLLRDAELMLVALSARRRRAGAGVDTLPVLGMCLPALAIVLAIVAPVASHLANAALAMGRPDVAAAAAAESASGRSGEPITVSDRRRNGEVIQQARSSDPADDPVSDAKVAVEDAATMLFQQAPRSDEHRALRHRIGVRTKASSESPPAKYEPDDDDPVGDAAYCVTHPIINPGQIGCEKPSSH